MGAGKELIMRCVCGHTDALHDKHGCFAPRCICMGFVSQPVVPAIPPPPTPVLSAAIIRLVVWLIPFALR
jgi:hypothetical protein